MATPGAPETLEETVEGAATIKAVRVLVTMDYLAASPLG
jgi:hypothetical protein